MKRMHVFELDAVRPLICSSPEEQGIPSRAVLDFFETVQKRDLEVDSIQIVRNGKLCLNAIARPYHEKSWHRIYSAAKGIVAAAILFAIQEGRFELHSRVIPLLPKEWIPEDLDEQWERLTVYHLLTMTDGHDRDTMFQMWGKTDCWIRKFFEVKPAYEPGTHFLYDMGAQYVMNEIIAHTTGQTTGEYLEERLFRKIGVEYTNSFTEPEGLFFSSTMQLHPDGLTRLALFYRNKGRWDGEQLLREDLSVLAGRHHVPSSHFVNGKCEGNFAGYALHMWRNKGGGFRLDGGQGQFGLVLPDENMAVGILSCADNAPEILDIFFDTIFASCYCYPVREDANDAARLRQAVQEFTLGPSGVLPHAELEKQISGAVYRLEPNPYGQETVSFIFLKDRAVIRTTGDHGEKEICCGLAGVFLENHNGYILTNKKPEEIADIDHNLGYEENCTLYTGGFRDPAVFEFRMRSASFLSDHRYQCIFSGDFLEIRMSNNSVNPRSMYRRRADAPDIVLQGKKIRIEGGET